MRPQVALAAALIKWLIPVWTRWLQKLHAHSSLHCPSPCVFIWSTVFKTNIQKWWFAIRPSAFSVPHFLSYLKPRSKPPVMWRNVFPQRSGTSLASSSIGPPQPLLHDLPFPSGSQRVPECLCWRAKHSEKQFSGCQTHALILLVLDPMFLLISVFPVGISYLQCL